MNTARAYGEQATFTIMAKGSEPFSYQWRKRGRDIEDGDYVKGANTHTLTVQNIQFKQMGQYSCIVKNEFGEIESQKATLNLKPHIIESPQNVTTESLKETTLTVSATGTEPLKYQWMKDDEVIHNDENVYGGDTSMLTIKCTDLMDKGCYSCVVKNQFGEVTSRRAYLKLRPKVPPVGQKPERYYDRLDKTDNWGQNNGTKMPPEANGYSSRDQRERSESHGHGFIPASKPIVTEHPRNRQIAYGEDITISMSGQGSEPLTYQWRKGNRDVKNGKGTTGAKTRMLTILNFQLEHTGNYCCIVSNKYGETRSLECSLGMLPTFIENPPMRLCKVVGNEAVFQALAVGSEPLTYRWKKDGSFICNDKVHKGADSCRLTIRKVMSTHSGHYVCSASNVFREAVSQECVLKVEDVKNEQTAKVVAQDLFKQLNLSQYYPQKLTLSHALCITQETLQSTECTDPKKLCIYILEKLMSYHYKCRADLFKQEQEENDDDDDDIFRRKSGKSKGSKTSNSIHPMDSLLALIHCADDFLRQDLLFRLAKCQLSIPLILPDPSTGQLTYLIWALRSIVKEWKSTLRGSEQAQQAPLVTSKIPIVSFVRFKKSISKSKMMNDVISDEYHDYFFHRDCQGGRYSRLLGEGLVDVCWYLPGGKKDDVFPLPVAFQNLHGDARKHRQQIEFMSRTCYMCFVLITEDDLDDEAVNVLEKLSKAPEGIILLQCSAIDQSHLLEKVKNIPHDKLKGFEVFNKNVAELKTMIRKRIKAKLDTKKWNIHERHVTTLFECKDMAHQCQLKVDEDKPELREGQELATILHETIRCEEASAKEKMLPLQGEDLWQKWAKCDKEEHRPVKSSKRAADFGEEKHLEKKEIRKLQVCRLSQESSKLINAFIHHVSSVKGNRRKYFLQCLKLSLNDQSRETISKLQQKYKEKRSELLKAEGGSDIAKLESIKRNIQHLQKEIIRVSLGLEHFLREMGQVYEATRGSHLENKYRSLPSIAAELLIDGFPLEIMDGDAAHVPEKWISSVMHETVKQLKDPNVFVMSVLGLQSTGKSTLINTAFGLQFNVSAGRCTRGAFMQLIPIGGTLKKESKCDFVLVVDTEGLRAPELDSQQTHKHDNELATFVTGLANVTMINIYGETPGDMDDILQTTVHALLRMRNVRLNPSCKFIHQNVAAVTASDKGGMGRARFKDKLDEMTRIAAKAEECENDYKHFKDVIKFNEEKDVFHFKGLWKGDPPMAPVNTGYSEAALSLKHNLVEMVRQSMTKFSSVATRIEDLWKALLHENFVFSFRNTLELNIYISLDAQFIQWSRTLGSKMLKWEEEIMEKEIKQAMNPETLKDTLLGQKIPTYVIQLFGDVEQEMKKYFEQSDNREVLVQWQKETENRLERLKFQLQNEAKDHCIQMIKGQQAHNEISSETSAYRAKVKERVKDVVRNLTVKELKQINEFRLKTIFNQEWKKWLDDLRSIHVSVAGETNVCHSVEEVLVEYFKTDQGFLIRNFPVEQWGKKLELEIPPSSEHVKVRSMFGGKASLNQEQKREVRAVAKAALMHAKGYLQGIKNKTFHPALVQELLKLVNTSITSRMLTFTKEYKIIVSLTACGYAVRVFEEMVNAFKKKNDPVELWKKEEKKLYTYFKNQYEEQVEIVKQREEEEERIAQEIKARERRARAERERIAREEEEARKAAARAKAAMDEAAKMEEEAKAERERKKREAEEAERREEERRAEEKAEKERKKREEAARQEAARKREEGAARIICDQIAESLESNVIKSLCSEVYEDMVELPFLKTKSAFKAEILTSLGEEALDTSNASDFIDYLTDVESSFKTWLERYTTKHCQQDSKLVSLAKGALEKKYTQLHAGVENATINVNTQRSCTSKAWLEQLCVCVSSLHVDWKTFDDFDGDKCVENTHYFEQEIKRGLEDKKALIDSNLEALTVKVLDDQQNRPYDRFFKDLCGCCEQCPFCGEQCDSTNDAHSGDHCVQQHRPQCLGGYRWSSTGIIVTDVCSSLVGSDNYFSCADTNNASVACKEYRTIYPRWSITIDLGAESSSYWKWFLANYCDKIADYYGAKASDIPLSWKTLQWNDVKYEMRKSYGAA